MILISFEDVLKIHNFSKLQGCGSRFEPATFIWISKFNWAWQAQFMSYNLETLEKWVFYKDLQMMLVPYFHIPAGFQLIKIVLKSSIHTYRRPCLISVGADAPITPVLTRSLDHQYFQTNQRAFLIVANELLKMWLFYLKIQR